MARLDGLVLGLNKSLKAIGGEAAGIRQIAAAGNATGAAMERASRHTAELERRLAALKIAGSVPTVPTMLPGGGGGGRGGGGGGYNRGGAHGGNIHMGPGGVGIGTVGMAAGDAFVPLAVTGAMLWGGHALYESAKDLNTEMQRFKLFGLSDKINNEAFQFVAGMKVYGTSQSENMRNFREAQGVFRESGLNDSEALEGAKLAAPVLSKLNFLAQSLGGEAGEKMATANMAMLRYVELSGGLKSAHAFNEIADFGWKLNQSSGGTVDWRQLLAFKKTAGSAGYNLSNDALARLEPIMAELSGGRAGTADQTAYNRIMGITRLPNQVAHALVDNGLWDASKITWNSQGGIKTAKGNPLSAANSKLFHENPELFYEQAIRPMYAKMKLDLDGITRENALIFGRTGGQFFNAIERAMPQIQMGISAVNRVKGINESVDQAKQSPSGQEVEFGAAWKDFKTQFGTAMLPTFTAILKDGAAVMRVMGDFMRDNGSTIVFIKKVMGIVGDAINPVQALIGAGRDLAGDFAGRDGKPEGSWGGSKINPVHGRGGQPTQAINNTIVMPNGQVLAKVVTEAQTRQASRPPTGGARFDSSMSPSPVGATGSW